MHSYKQMYLANLYLQNICGYFKNHEIQDNFIPPKF